METAEITIGTPVYTQGKTGYVAAILQPAAVTYSLGGPGGIRRTRSELEIVWPGRVETTPDSIAATWIEAAQRANIPPIEESEIPARKAAALAAQAEARTAREAEAQRDREAYAAFKAEAARRMPAGSKAAIIAEFHRDDSDSMTDYFNHKTERRVLLAWSKHTRDLFPEMRKAAALFPETADLATAPDSAEHRENYSMGAGNYLKNGFRDSTGWAVKKCSLYRGVDSLSLCEFLPDTPAPAAQAEAQPVDGARIESHFHTKGGFPFWIVILAHRVDRETYESLLSKARAAGGWYSRAWGTTPAGFAFKAETAAQEFAQGLAPAPVDVPAAQAETAPRAAAVAAGAATAAKLRALADRLDSEIESKFRDRLENTPKRSREAQSARLDGYRLQRTQRGLRALADMWEAGAVPAELQGIRTKAAAFEIARAELFNKGGYYDAGVETGRPALNTPAALAFWAICGTRSPADMAAADLKAKIAALQFANIPGYFPTPAAVVQRMLDAARIFPGAVVLEPSAGSGAIVDAIRAAQPDSRLMVFERHESLRQILQAKGYSLAGADFMESDSAVKADFVLMNPPFERAQDIDHVRRAWAHLTPGGRLVAIMSGGTFQRSDSKAREFRAWVEGLGGTWEALPEGSFKESGTGAATVLVTVDGPRGAWEIVESKAWVNAAGRTVSPYGAAPWASEAQKVAEGWELQTRGFTVRNSFTGEIGIGRAPWATREEAQAWIDAAPAPSRIGLGD